MAKFSKKAKKALMAGKGVYFVGGKARVVAKRRVAKVARKAKKVRMSASSFRRDTGRRAKKTRTLKLWAKNPGASDLVTIKTINGKKRRVRVLGV